MARKARVPSSADVKANAERTYQRYLPATMLRSLGIGGKQKYNYVYGITPGGKIVYWGPLPVDEADACASGLIDGEVFEIDTKDLRKATQAIKAEKLRRGNDPDKALSRGHHTGMQEFMDKLRGKENSEKALDRITGTHRPV